MKLVCLNAWGGRENDSLLKFVAANTDTDVFCFQEIYSGQKDEGTLRARSINSELYGDLSRILKQHTGHFLPCARPTSGIACFLSNDIALKASGEVILFENPDFKDWNMKMDHTRKMAWYHLSVNGRELLVMNVHGHWVIEGKQDNPARIIQSQRIVDLMQKFSCPKILCGDFNLRPDTKSVRMFEEFGLRNLVVENGITSTRSPLHTKDEKFADFIFVSPEIKVNDFKVLPDVVSDHAPLFLDFEVV